jgi:glycosyltransferase involved in cell wall biosynthesis
MKGVSIIICCYNSSNRLPKTLEFISLQKVNKNILLEIIVINNNSSDNTVEVASEVWGKFGKNEINFKIVDEKKPGLSYARKKGTSAASYDCLIFCDDDNWLFENYVEDAYSALEKNDKIGIIGGFGLPETQSTPPNWFSKYSSFYATGPQFINNDNSEENCPYVYGAGMVVRKSLFEKLNTIQFKFLATDRTNNLLSSGGDIELCYIAQLLGYKIVYNQNLKFHHYIESPRLTKQYLKNLAFQFGYCNVVHRPYFWLFNRSLPNYKKNWIWTILISINIYLLTLVKNIFAKPSDNLANEVNLSHATGRMIASVKLNFKINKDYSDLIRNLNTIICKLKP